MAFQQSLLRIRTLESKITAREKAIEHLGCSNSWWFKTVHGGTFRATLCDILQTEKRLYFDIYFKYHIACYDGYGYQCDLDIPMLEKQYGQFLDVLDTMN